MSRLRRAAIAAGLLLPLAAACGQKGPPLPPLRPLPVAPSDLSARVVGDRVTLQLRVPSTSQDPEAPAMVARVDIYAYSAPFGADPPRPRDLVRREYLAGSVEVRPAPAPGDPPPPAGAPADPRPAPGELATWTETVPPVTATTPQLRVAQAPAVRRVPLRLAPSGVAVPFERLLLPARYYVAVAVSSRGRDGLPSPALTVRLVDVGDPPDAPTLRHSETELTLSWSAPAGTPVAVYASTPLGEEQPAPVQPAPITTGTWSTPVVFGQERCFTVRRVRAVGAVTYQSRPAGPACHTAVDTYPPPAPTAPTGVAEPGRITIEWTGVSAPDLVGYHVLRADGPEGTLRPLTTTPETATLYADRAVQAGVEYTYVIVAVDRAGNVSAQSAPFRLRAR